MTHPVLAELRPMLLAMWASFLRQWQEIGREKVRWLAILLNVATLLVPLLLAQLAFGSEGFAASGGGENVAAFVAVGWLAMQVAQSAVTGTQGYLRWGNETGVLPHLWTTRVARWVPIAGVTLFELVYMLIFAVAILAVVLPVAGGFPAVSLLSIPVILLSLIAFSGMGLAMGALGLVVRQWQVPRLIDGIAFLLAGAAFPIAVLPAEIRWLSYGLPHTYALDAMRHTLLGTPTLVPLWAELLILCLSAVVAGIGGIAVFNRLDRYATRRGLVGLVHVDRRHPRRTGLPLSVHPGLVEGRTDQPARIGSEHPKALQLGCS